MKNMTELCECAEWTRCGELTGNTDQLGYHPDCPKLKPLTAYKLRLPDVSDAWIYAGKTPAEVAHTVLRELQEQDFGGARDRDKIALEPYNTTQAAIDSLPEFGGW